MKPRAGGRPADGDLDLADVLRLLYDEQLEARPDDPYLKTHADSQFLEGTVSVYRFYRPYLTGAVRVLDWGCRHAPDACLLRHDFGPELELEGCDLAEAADYSVFFQYAGLKYTRLQDTVRLPYPDCTFDVVVASGVLEHVAMDYESLKELYRVLRGGGRLIVTYLPNAASVAEWWLRRWRKKDFHVRTYSRRMIRELLVHTGFRPVFSGYQTRLDALDRGGAVARMLGAPLRLAGLHRLTSCLAVVGEKAVGF